MVRRVIDVADLGARRLEEKIIRNTYIEMPRRLQRGFHLRRILIAVCTVYTYSTYTWNYVHVNAAFTEL